MCVLGLVVVRVYMWLDIGTLLLPLMHRIMEADRLLDEATVKVSNYRCNIPKSVFLQGEPMQVLLAKVESAVRQKIM